MEQMEAFSAQLPHHNPDKPPNTKQNPNVGRIIHENRKIQTAHRITDGRMASLDVEVLRREIENARRP
jgi:hypothetical protein